MRNAKLLATVLGATLLLAIVAGGTAFAVSRALSGPTYKGIDNLFVIPKGAGATIDAGGHLDIIPDRLDLKVHDRLVLINEDDRDHEVGPFVVRAGEILRQQFDEPGRFVGVCSVHPEGEIAVVIT